MPVLWAWNKNCSIRIVVAKTIWRMNKPTSTHYSCTVERVLWTQLLSRVCIFWLVWLMISSCTCALPDTNILGIHREDESLFVKLDIFQCCHLVCLLVSLSRIFVVTSVNRKRQANPWYANNAISLEQDMLGKSMSQMNKVTASMGTHTHTHTHTQTN